ncbi:conserved protein, unknown function [Plasmodium knowlesi strain H]|uniref:Ion transport domain-containing protein n=2 Tax=Plasmodium knowlesi TaxID=5850 RepID=B3LA91_PLAKH|nr:uncharacterized protein PKNH_1328700 [Plasmodium knowlesi strain H]OTN67838.1 Uncharacterized protein PKNOH_S05373300 [Plasmodium knowlesi]CAA9990323.1 conserved protein, unknown function [Plasmodium knowlesi strain H]VVS79797.1 conserved protein, unknown function [Plasmodium knowlesi strain H]|eukprot:XP_002260723.1 [Plasmodium knowlesi strain H]
MDIFIDEEINGSDENEAVLLEIDDLLSFKDPPPQRKGEHSRAAKRERTNYKQESAHGTVQGGTQGRTQSQKHNGHPNQAGRYPPWEYGKMKFSHREREDITEDENEWLIKKRDLSGHHHEDDLEDHLTHHVEEADALAAKGRDQNPHSVKSRRKYYPSYSYPVFANIYERAKRCYGQMVDGLTDKFTGNKERDDDDGEGFFYYKNHTSFDFFHILANRLYYSKGTMYLYFLVIILNLFILVYTAYTKMVSLFVVLSEMFVILMLVLEVCLRLATQGRSYFHNFEGLFDVTVTIMCFLLLISSGDLKVFYQPEMIKTKNKEVEEIISQSLTVLRFSFQLFRTLTLFMHYERVKTPSENIDFSVLNLPHEEEEEDDYVI